MAWHVLTDALAAGFSIKPVLNLVATASVAGAAGFSPLPRLGFERALLVAIRSVRPVSPHSQRVAQLASFNNTLKLLTKGSFAAVVGQQVSGARGGWRGEGRGGGLALARGHRWPRP